MTIRIHAVRPLPRSGLVHGFAIDAPGPGDEFDADAIELDGWVVGAGWPIVAIEVVGPGGIRGRLAVGRHRPDVAAAYPARPWAAASGFRGMLPASGLPPRFVLDAHAVDAAGSATPLVRIEAEIVPYLPVPEDEGSEDWPGPDFVVIGAQRSGSTSLYDYLTQHPRIAPAAMKELKYFTAFHDRPWGWYRRQFPAPLPQGTLTGEATPYYLFHPHAPRRLAARLPHARLLAVLRNPVDRAYSQYQMKVRRGIEPLSFEEALEREEERLAEAGEDRASLPWRHFSYVARGRYAEQLERWFALFPRERFHVIQSEAFDRDPEGVLRETQVFLGLAPDLPRDLRMYHRADYAPMDSATRERLAALFAPLNRRLYALLGTDFGWERGA